MIDWTGKKVGNYQLVRPIGQGGFADVYLGQHIYLQTYAAIKILQSRLDQNDLGIFLSEARTIASLTHPNIVRVLEFGEEGRTPYLVMDYCADGSLRRRHPKGSRLSLRECVSYVRQVAAALQYAHERKIIHRDVKAENMLVGRDDSILLGDFGIAIVAQSSRYSNRQEMGGTIAYAAPEQLQGKATFASDQYALGVLVYEWLVGELPFKGSFVEIASQHVLNPVPSVREKVPNLPPAVDQVLQKALAKDAQQRFGSVQGFAEALAQAADGTYTGSMTWVRPGNQANIPTYIAPPSPPAYGPTINAQSSPLPGNTFMSNMQNMPTVNTSFSSNPPFLYPQNQEIKRSQAGKSRTIITVLVLLVLLLGGVSFWSLSRSFTSPSNTSGGTNSGHASGGTQTNSKEAATATSVPVVVSTAPAGSGTISKNLRLTCTCDDPIKLTVKTIVIDQNKGNMTWDLAYTNVGGQNYQFYMNDLHLSSSLNGDQQTYNASGAIMQGYTSPMGVLTNGLNAGQTLETQVIFSFDPLKNTQYTLSAWILNDGNTYVSIKFDDMPFTFS